MSLQFILGRSGTEKGQYCLDSIQQKLLASPDGPPILYVVPEQMTFEQEYALLKQNGIEGSIRAQVFSFSRLAWRVFQETGGGTKKFITSTGVQMMLRKITEERKGDWKVFQKAIEKQGFMEQLEGMITEFKRYRIAPEDLADITNQMDQFKHSYPGEETLQNKLEDLAYIYEQLTDALREHYIDNEDQLQLLAEKIKEADFLQDAEIYLDGFYRFTPQELYVLEALMQKAKKVTITLTIDQIPGDEIDELDLFYQTKKTYGQIQELARQNQLHELAPIWLQPVEERFQERPYFTHLEQNFDEHPIVAYDEQAPMKLAQAVHPRAEVEGVAQEILRLVRDEGFRYRDLAILIRESDVYHDLIQTIFSDYEIPVFVDEKRTMLNHPLIELIRSSLDMIEGNWRYDALFRVLKTDFIPKTDSSHPLNQEAIDELENYVLEYGIRSRHRWLEEKEWIYQRFRGFDAVRKTNKEQEKEFRINRLRKQVTAHLGPFDEQIRNQKTVQERCTAIFQWLEALGVPETLEKWRDYYDETGQIEHAREQEQVWDAVIQLFDEMVEMIGDEEMSLSIFRTTLETGFESLSFAHVPPSMDHVIVGDVDRSRISGVKGAFLLGVNEGTWPLKPASDGMISEDERSLLNQHGLLLADSSSRKLLDDRFYVYVAFTTPKDYLWVSYPLSNEEGKTKTPSPLINRMKEMFPRVEESLLLEDEDEENPLRFITVPEKTRAVLTSQLAKYLRGYKVDDVFWDVYQWYVDHHPKTSRSRRVLMSLFYENRPVLLDKTTVKKLYPEQVNTSVSRIESFYRCQYQHFAQYALGLKERQVYKLDAPDIGQLFHEALKQITDWIIQEGKSYRDLNREDAEQYAKRAVQTLSPILQHQILFSSNRYQYILRKLEQVISRATNILSDQAKRSDFTPAGIELGFGPKEKLPPMNLPLPDGYELVLRGRIDRVDRADIGENLYLRIIDYKSSAKDLNLVEVYYGLSLQMLAYLDVVLSNAEQWLGKGADPAGVLYFHVHNPMISDPKSLNSSDIEQEIFKEFKMKGLLLEDVQVVQRMDLDLSSGISPVVPAGFKNDGSFRKGSKTLDHPLFERLRGYVRSLLTQAGTTMTSGKVELNPFQDDQVSACTFCSFKSVCQFDHTLEENNYRILKKEKDADILQEIERQREEGNQ
ncbi:helicase-exonuclease AddAB subunit AddB [Salinibacillus xinjiangensis]|uniref:ATP-dependent helicase/deoxyribonuclease subunit B n=1 Tax=Salinibacillus xinjiangensis TaxID=1229268 RepID=A0A6G1X7W5_9BACI|nr:helicase-exonuclease AddAB subunit AddB [Salinibacillus xinjiangensis]MRG87032.1 helicase-exonuclease AddAB subunit AddB [Salinibacillus xinjiangensis]